METRQPSQHFVHGRGGPLKGSRGATSAAAPNGPRPATTSLPRSSPTLLFHIRSPTRTPASHIPCRIFPHEHSRNHGACTCRQQSKGDREGARGGPHGLPSWRAMSLEVRLPCDGGDDMTPAFFASMLWGQLAVVCPGCLHR